jgi:hypothetical protein
LWRCCRFIARGVQGSANVWPAPGNVLVLRQAQDEDEFDGGSVEIFILSLSKDEDVFAPPFEPPRSSLPNRTAVPQGRE